MIVCFDTNVLISALATRGLCADIVNLTLAEHQLVIGPTVLAELRRVLLRKLKIPSAVVDEVEDFLRLHATVAETVPDSAIEGLDDNDRVVLAEAIAGRADVLMTGDHDLINFGTQAPIRILSPRGFWELLRSD